MASPRFRDPCAIALARPSGFGHDHAAIHGEALRQWCALHALGGWSEHDAARANRTLTEAAADLPRQTEDASDHSLLLEVRRDSMAIDVLYVGAAISERWAHRGPASIGSNLSNSVLAQLLSDTAAIAHSAHGPFGLRCDIGDLHRASAELRVTALPHWSPDGKTLFLRLVLTWRDIAHSAIQRGITAELQQLT